MIESLKHFNDPDIKVSALFAAFGTAISNFNALLTSVFLMLNIGFICWRWNKNRKNGKDE